MCRILKMEGTRPAELTIRPCFILLNEIIGVVLLFSSFSSSPSFPNAFLDACVEWMDCVCFLSGNHDDPILYQRPICKSHFPFFFSFLILPLIQGPKMTNLPTSLPTHQPTTSLS